MSAPIINQAWEDVASDVTGAIEKAVQPLLKKAVDEVYSGLLETTQDYLSDNLAFNIASRISTAEREASDARQENERLRATLLTIAGGSISGASGYALAGAWQAFASELQRVAQDALGWRAAA